jgi:hypothetical protein
VPVNVHLPKMTGDGEVAGAAGHAFEPKLGVPVIGRKFA